MCCVECEVVSSSAVGFSRIWGSSLDLWQKVPALQVLNTAHVWFLKARWGLRTECGATGGVLVKAKWCRSSVQLNRGHSETTSTFCTLFCHLSFKLAWNHFYFLPRIFSKVLFYRNKLSKSHYSIRGVFFYRLILLLILSCRQEGLGFYPSELSHLSFFYILLMILFENW